MDRHIVVPGAGALDTDFLHAQRNAMIGLGRLAQAILGAGPALLGFGCSPGGGLSVSIAPGDIYQLEAVDSTAYGSLAASATQVVKQGSLTSALALACPAPAGAGQSIAYLIQIEQADVDEMPVTLNFFDSSNPSVPYTGPNNTGAQTNTLRASTASVTVKAGAAAATGSQAPPAPDAGFVGAWVVTVPYGAGTVTAPMITIYPNAPFLTETLQQKISEATGDQRYIQIGAAAGGDLSGTLPSPTLNAIGAAAAPNLLTAIAFDTKGRVTGARTLNKVQLVAGATWTPPAGVTQVYAEMVGGGGGGAGAGSAKSGGGGGAGGYCAGVVAVTPGTPVPINVGAAGNGGGSGQDGSNGGQTSFAGLSAGGGGGGVYNASTAGGPAGQGSGGALNLWGGPGTDGNPTGTNFAGNGGASFFGGGGRGGSGGGVQGLAPGSGGGGAYNSSGPGGNGTAGQIILSF